MSTATDSIGAAVRPAGIVAARWMWALFAATVGGAVTGALYFAYEGVWAIISDSVGGLMGVAVLLAARHTARAVPGGAAASASLYAGVAAGAATIAGSIGLIGQNLGPLDDVLPDMTWLGVQFIGMGLIGLWVLLATRAGAGRIFGRLAVVLAWIVAIGYGATGFIEPILGFPQTIMGTAGSLGILAFAVWVPVAAVALRRRADRPRP